MRDVKNLYARANTCIACHQIVAQPLLKAGHPELIFELDGQCVSQPKHWREKTNWHGAQAWLVGQAAALREMCWELSGGATETSRAASDQGLIGRADALLWLLQKLVRVPAIRPPQMRCPERRCKSGRLLAPDFFPNDPSERYK